MTACTLRRLALSLSVLVTAGCRPAQPDHQVPTDAAPLPSPGVDAPSANGVADPVPEALASVVVPGLEPYPGSTRFCDGRVYPQGVGAHLSWASWSTTDAMDIVVAHYTGTLGTAELERTTDDATWRFPADRPTRTLSVEPPTASAPWSVECNVPRDARSIVTITHFPR
jgi:hypothetical protein